MRNLLDFLLKYNYFLLFVLLEVICFILLFRFNNYQGNVFFTSANYVAGKIYDASSHITRYVGLDEMNRQLTARNVELEMEITALRQEMEKYTQDSTVTDRLLSQSHTEYRAYPARVVNNQQRRGRRHPSGDGSGKRKRSGRHRVPDRSPSFHHTSGFKFKKQYQL